MKKTKVDRIIGIMVTLNKQEVDELCKRLLEEHSIFTIFSVPTSKIGGTITEGKWLKEGEKAGM